MSRTLTPLALAVAQAKRLGSRPVARDASAAVDAVDPDRAMTQLAPFIKETAQRIHGRYYSLRRQLASDFVSHAPALVWTRIEHFADWYHQELPPAARAEESKDFFAAWCYRELHFRYLDAGRGQKAEPKVKPLETSAGPTDVADHRSAIDEPSVYDFALSAADVARLRDEWDPLDAVILFSLGNQWEQVPAELWAHWLDELSLQPPFPPPEFVSAPKVKRRAVLAEALGVSRDVIFQRWHRLKDKYLS